MQTPLLLSTNVTTGPSTSSIQFTPPVAGSANASWRFTSADVATPVAAAGTISNLSIRFPNTGTGTYQVTLYLNGSPTALTCTVDLSTGSTASDSSHSIAVSAGDLIAWQVTPSGTPTAQTVVQISSVFTGSTSILLGSSANAALTSDFYLSWGGMYTNASEANASVVCPTSGTIDKLYINQTVAPGSGNSWVHTIYKNGVATGVTCTVADTATTGSDLSNSITVAAGDTLSLLAHAVNTPAGTLVRFGARFTPTVGGESILFTHWTTSPSAAADRFSACHGNVSNDATESNNYNLAPIDFTLKKLYLNLGTAPGTGKTRSVWIRSGGADTALTCGASDANTAANDTSHSVAVTSGSLIDIRTNSTAAATLPGTMRVGTVAFIAPAGASGSTGNFFSVLW